MSGIFNKAERERLAEEAKKGRESRGGSDQRDLLDPSLPHIVVITSVEQGSYESKEKSKVFTLNLTIEKHTQDDRAKFKPIVQRYSVHQEAGPGGKEVSLDMSIKMLIDFLQNSFGAELPDASGMDDLTTKMKKFIDMPFKIAVRHKERLWERKDENTHKIEGIKQVEQVMYYSGKIDDATFRGTKAANRLVPMKEEELKRFNELNGTAAAQADAVNNADFSDPGSAFAAAGDDDPFK